MIYWGSIFVLLAFSNLAYALHEPDHRFVVSGYVRDKEGAPRSGIDVLLTHKSGQKHKKTTDSFGFYEAVFHLHDGNSGEEIVVTVGDEVKRVKMAFDPNDHVSPRLGEASFGAPASANPYVWAWVAGGALLAGMLAYGLRMKREAKKSRKAAARAAEWGRKRGR